MSESKECVKYQDNRITRLWRQKLTNKKICQNTEMVDVNCDVGVLCEYLKDSRVKVMHENNNENPPLYEAEILSGYKLDEL